MPEYIEREAVIIAYQKSLHKDTHKTFEASRIHAQEHHYIMHILENEPAADVVDVVRCKDCKHRGGDICPMCHLIWQEDGGYGYTDITMDENYCSYGERKEKSECQ